VTTRKLGRDKMPQSGMVSSASKGDATPQPAAWITSGPGNLKVLGGSVNKVETLPASATMTLLKDGVKVKPLNTSLTAGPQSR
jgi:hypothetical protein